MLTYLLLGVAPVGLWYVFIRPVIYFERMGVKQLRPWPILGNLYVIVFRISNICDFIKYAYDSFSKSRYEGVYQFNRPVLILNNPELIKELTTKDFDHFTDHKAFNNPEADPLWSNNLFSLKGLKQMRATLNGSFTISKMKHMFALINETAQNFSRHFMKKEENLIQLERKDIFTRIHISVDIKFTLLLLPLFFKYVPPDKVKFKQARYLRNDDISSQTLLSFFAGFETVSTAFCHGAHELAMNKDVQDKLREEIRETDKLNNGKLTYDALLKMKYMDMVFCEILRKWPPVFSMDRVCTKPYTIEPKYPDEKPVHLKVGDVFWFPMFGLYRDPKYFPKPEVFDPERFSDENRDQITPYSYIPFGVGPRNCIGSRFAILESKALIYNLLLNFEIVPTKKTANPLKFSQGSFQNTVEGGFWLGLKHIKQ
ncbi:hypothetical protein ABEB36_004464 [Hypothenemus hampei]|uniref:Cytochrome P450 n=1 Tax=Hypothenemus hampei TaxID=57062 RepID=A0ABD1F757_HYPHA